MKRLFFTSLIILSLSQTAVANLKFVNVENGTVEPIDMEHVEYPAQTYYPITGTIKSLAIGKYHICAIENESVRCWGTDKKILLATPNNLLHPRALVAGDSHSCVIDDEGVKCWGNNDSNQTIVPKNIKNPKILVAGKSHNCVIDDEGVKCWGNNSDGQSTVPNNLKNPKQIALSDTQTCVIDNEGVKCWGLGIANKKKLSKFPTMISGGSDHFCVIDSPETGDKMIECWGEGLRTQHSYDYLDYKHKITSMASGFHNTCIIIDNDVSCLNYESNLYEPLTNLKKPTIIAANEKRSCVVDDNRIICWGEDSFGNIPPPNSLINPKEMASGNSHTCAIDDEGIKCWGSNNYWQLMGYNRRQNPIAISAGFNHTCVIGDTGSINAVNCWGGGDANYSIVSNVPEYLKNPVSISSGYDYSCVADDNGVKCWGGKNVFGQTSVTDHLINPRLVVAETRRACALDDIGLKCWGETSPQIMFDQSRYFYREKGVPLKRAQELLESIKDSRETKSSLFYFREVITDLFLTGALSETAPIISENSKNIRQLYKNKKLVNGKILAARNSTQLRFLLEIMVSTFDSSKYLLSESSKKSVDKLKVDFAAVLSEEVISLNMTNDLMALIFNEESLMKEISASYRLIGIKTFYDWANKYVQSGEVDF